VLAGRRQRGPLAVQRPFYPESDVCHLYLLHPPGGVVGGDSLDITVGVAPEAHALLTTPGASKFYRSAGPLASLEQRLRVADEGVLEWFPQENILFPGARLRSRTSVELSGNGRFIGWEIHSLGRPVIGERFESGSADLGLFVFRNGRPLLLERLRLDSSSDLDLPSGPRGFPVMGTLIASGADSDDIEAARQGILAPPGLLFGITLVDELLVARCLADAVETVQRIFLGLWGILRCRLIGRTACPPRIWAT
jgi:urease accessory protein